MESMYGKCEICSVKGGLSRTYFHYDLKCECHSPNHFEIVNHCKNCVPKEPNKTTVYLKPIQPYQR
jgi:hypothetical protein